MIDRRTIRVFMAVMACMSFLCMLAMGGAFFYARLTHDPAEDAAFEAKMREHDAFLQEHVRRREEHVRRMEAYWQEREARKAAAPQEDKAPCP